MLDYDYRLSIALNNFWRRQAKLVYKCSLFSLIVHYLIIFSTNFTNTYSWISVQLRTFLSNQEKIIFWTQPIEVFHSSTINAKILMKRLSNSKFEVDKCRGTSWDASINCRRWSKDVSSPVQIVILPISMEPSSVSIRIQRGLVRLSDHSSVTIKNLSWSC
jgi:hypothetical protein